MKDLCASAAKAALDTLNTGASTKFTSLKEAMIAFAEESKSNARRKIFLTRDDLVQDIVQITLNHNVNMEYIPTLKEVMTAFPWKAGQTLIQTMMNTRKNSSSTRVISYILSGVHFIADQMPNPHMNRLPVCWK